MNRIMNENVDFPNSYSCPSFSHLVHPVCSYGSTAFAKDPYIPFMSS